MRQMRIRLETVAITMIFALIESGHLSARWSFVLDYENNRDPVPERREFAQYLSRCCESTFEPDESVRELARGLSETHQIRGRARVASCPQRWLCCRITSHGDRRRFDDQLSLGEGGRRLGRACVIPLLDLAPREAVAGDDRRV
jgi:hypothetical protein